jgi:biopolymer transport protein ExbD
MSLTRKKFKKRGTASTEMSLNITSMADIFTIILVFLLKGYATSAVSISPNPDLFLPTAQAGDTASEALKVEISKTGVQLDGVIASPLTGFQFEANDLDQNGTSKTLTARFEILRNRQLYIAKNNEQVKVDSRMIIIADQHTPYSTIKRVLASGAIHGYTDFKLAVVSPQ